MKLNELLDELREGILNDRSDRVDGTSDYLWTDARLVRYIDAAEQRFAIQGLVIRDGGTDETCLVTLVEGQTEYPLHEAVLAVVSAKRETAVTDLARVGHALLGAYRAPDDSWDAATLTAMSPGAPLAYSTDEGVSAQYDDSMSQVILRVYPAPDADAAGTTVRMRVVRKPIERLVVTKLGATPEIPEEHHLEMLDWAAYLALRIVDQDAGAPKRAAEFAQSFQVHVNNARKTAMRKMFAPLPWGFGRSGFSWGS
jgi:hypothetical protein